ncbi:hypothetical protein CVT26_010786 [Gymnopilus dilepis]|uniref:Uncharacterized protein n=1 Tax=Gymnopilus dilepis TaxID=231916 RepID=A0A409VIE7_9AGAR|nr:hypothetical protein CVT26_010786 [Gymnopilus dilepis]
MSISSLPNEILLHIFDCNTIMARPFEANANSGREGTQTEDDSRLTHNIRPASSLSWSARRGKIPLVAALRLSRVCQRWRKILLSVPSIWGRLLDLNVLKHPDLLEEIYRRAGTSSLLAVKGENLPYPSRSTWGEFLFRLIQDDWARLQWIDVTFDAEYGLQARHEEIWMKIKNPAPNLWHFAIKFYWRYRVDIPPMVLTDAAPALREFCATVTSPLRLDAPWLQQLTYIYIDGSWYEKPPYSLPDILNAFRDLPSLKTLRLMHLKLREKAEVYSDVELLSLQEFTVQDEFENCVAALRHIKVSPRCLLVIKAISSYHIPPWDYRPLATWMKDFLMGRSYNEIIHIDLQRTYARFCDAYDDCYPAPTTSFSIDFLNYYGMNAREVNLTKGSLQYDKEFPKAVIDLYRRLKLVKVLKTNLKGFPYLEQASKPSEQDADEVPPPLPKLFRLRIISDEGDPVPGYLPLDEWECGFDGDRFCVDRFCEAFIEISRPRYRHRKPIKVLDIRGCHGDLTRLDICKGLKVVWLHAEDRERRRKGVYTCGSGRSKALNIKYV